MNKMSKSTRIVLIVSIVSLLIFGGFFVSNIFEMIYNENDYYDISTAIKVFFTLGLFVNNLVLLVLSIVYYPDYRKTKITLLIVVCIIYIIDIAFAEFLSWRY